ncbi:MAG: metallophosphoesterase [Propionibacteriaceae bacterium]|nr:metallophosphoesterase [Propionibacteriaceae bacterium]
MSDRIAFVGDIHGNLPALRGIWKSVLSLGPKRVVFLGDYINKGTQSAPVMQELVEYKSNGLVTLLRGNHEMEFLNALESGDLRAFLKMGGAMSIRSYIGHKVGPDVASDLRASVPSQHLDALRQMPDVFEANDIVAQHLPIQVTTNKFAVSAHARVGRLPIITKRTAEIDTGCGSKDGRLTALMWPSLRFMQVDTKGRVVQD